MKRIVCVGLVLIFVLSACAPAQAAPAPVAAATNAPAVAATEVVVVSTQPAEQANNTAAPQATQIDTPVPPPPPQSQNPPPGSVFVDASRSRDAFSLRCAPTDITFRVKSVNPAVASVDFYYRVRNKATGTAAGTWRNGAQMDGDGQGNYSLVFPASKTSTEARYEQSWFDYQFVGLSKFGDVIGRSERFTEKVTFTIDCP